MDTGVLKNGSTTQPNSSVCQTAFAYGPQPHEGLAGAGGSAPTGTPGRGMDRLAGVEWFQPASRMLGRILAGGILSRFL